MFGAYLVDRGSQSSTLASYFSAIKSILRWDGYPWNEGEVVLGALIRGCRHTNDSIKTRLPIQRKLLEAILFEVERKFGGPDDPQPYLETLYKAIFSTAYYGLMRIGELAQGDHTVRAGDVSLGQNKDKILLMLYTSKTHSRRSGPQYIKISAVENKSNNNLVRFFCPFRLISSYSNMRGPCCGDDDAFFVYSDGSPVPLHNFRKGYECRMLTTSLI